MFSRSKEILLSFGIFSVCYPSTFMYFKCTLLSQCFQDIIVSYPSNY